MLRLVAIAGFLVACSCAALASAQERPVCPDDFEQWVADCASQSEGVTLASLHCNDGVAIVVAGSEGEHVEIELSPSQHASFVRVGDIGVSPIGDFDDWSTAPAGIRRGFDAVRACIAARAPSLSGTTGVELSPIPHEPDPLTQQVGLAQRIGLAIAALTSWIAIMLAAARDRRRRIDVLAAIGVAAGAIIFRWLAVDPAFFHQNGHGAAWVEQALCGTTTYGPGYASVFHLTARAAGVPAERGVFVTQEVLAALAVAAIYAIARSLAASRLTALALAVALGIDPLLARLARSESYFALALSLITMAIAALLVRGPRTRRRDPWLWAGVTVGALLLSIAVTVHPVAWVPVACAPSVLLLRSRSRRERWSPVLGAAVVALFGCALTLPAVLAVLHGSLGRQWGDHAPQTNELALLVLTLASPWVAVALPRPLAAWAAPCLVIVSAIVAERSTNMFGTDSTIAPAEAWRLLFAATWISAVIALVVRLASLARRRIRRAPMLVAIAIVALGVGHAAFTFERATTLPTDALELQRFTGELQSLPANARLHYLPMSGRMRQSLPLYTRCGVTRIELRSATLQSPEPIAAGDYWFRSATCSTTEGRPFCDDVERRLVLRPIDVVRLPARPSLPYLPYDGPEVVSGLYHVEALRDP